MYVLICWMFKIIKIWRIIYNFLNTILTTMFNAYNSYLYFKYYVTVLFLYNHILFLDLETISTNYIFLKEHTLKTYLFTKNFISKNHFHKFNCLTYQTWCIIKCFFINIDFFSYFYLFSEKNRFDENVIQGTVNWIGQLRNNLNV